MYAQPGYQPPNARAAGLSGALIICAGFGAMLMLLAPKIATTFADPPIKTYNVPKEVPPPRIPEEKPLPKADTPQNPLIAVPIPDVRVPVLPTLPTTNDIPDTLPPPTVVEKAGPPAVADPPKPLPPLVPATADPRADFKAPYPPSELRAGRDGVVALRVRIGADGRVKAIEQVSATSSAFFDAARKQALAKWRFRPATRGGVAEESWKTVTVRFRIEDQ